MQRRQFLELAFGATAAGALTACAGRAATASGPAATTGKPLDAAAFGAARRFAATPAGKIAFFDSGDSGGAGAAALFLHGLPLNSFQWRGAIDRLAPHRRCIAPDFLGLGYTAVAAGQSCFPAAQAAMIIALLDALSIPVVDLVASDSGGGVAQLIAIRHPKRIRTMLLTNCDTEPDSPPAAVLPVIQEARAGTFADNWLAPDLADKQRARTKGIGTVFSHADRLADETIDYYFAPLLSSPARKAQLHDYIIGLDPNPLAGVEAALKQCTIPTRIVWGAADTIFQQSSADYLDRTLPRSRGIRRVPDGKLFFPEEYPDVIAEEARRLWQAG